MGDFIDLHVTVFLLLPAPFWHSHLAVGFGNLGPPRSISVHFLFKKFCRKSSAKAARAGHKPEAFTVGVQLYIMQGVGSITTTRTP